MNYKPIRRLENCRRCLKKSSPNYHFNSAKEAKKALDSATANSVKGLIVFWQITACLFHHKKNKKPELLVESAIAELPLLV